MNELLEQFLSESRDFLQGIAEKLMALEKAPDDRTLMNELFRLVHTLKGNSGLFDAPEMTRVLHAGEDLMDAVRNGQLAYSQDLADRLLDSMDFVSLLCDELEAEQRIGAGHASDAARLAQDLRALIPGATMAPKSSEEAAQNGTPATDTPAPVPAESAAGPDDRPATELPDDRVPEAERMDAYRRACAGEPLHWIRYRPDEQCFYQGEDPLFQARQTPELLWGGIRARADWPPLAELDAYACVLDLHLLSAAPRAALDEHFRYVPDQVDIQPLSRFALAVPQGDPNGGPVYEDFAAEARRQIQSGDSAALKRAIDTMLALTNPELWISSALRWLQLILESEPDNSDALLALVDSLSTFDPPVFADSGEPPAAPPVSPARSAPSADQLQNPSPEQAQEQPETELTLALGTVAAEQADGLKQILAAQREVLTLDDEPGYLPGRLKACAAALSGCVRSLGLEQPLAELNLAETEALQLGSAAPLLAWLDSQAPGIGLDVGALSAQASKATLTTEPSAGPISGPAAAPPTGTPAATPTPKPAPIAAPPGGEEIKFGRRAEDQPGAPKALKVDQEKIDRLMGLIGEMVVAKNALPYVAARAEDVFKVRELSRDIKGHYSIINRIAEEMQDAIMQVRMMPVSFIFQRFPRLVRDISRKLGKQVELVTEGGETEADKNIIEALGDPLVHILRNSLDHGIEDPETRRAAGKPPAGTLRIQARQESDRVVIEIIDDGKGIDPEVIKRKAYAKGLIDEAALERLSDQEAVNLVFAAGFSTAEQVSDLSGRGVGMDVVRTAVEKVNGTLALTSQKGQGTRLRLALPLSMAVTNVMIIVSDDQQFGVPMDAVVETVRVPRTKIRIIKQSLATVLRGRIVPLKSLNQLLGLPAEPIANDDDELAVLVARIGADTVGLLVDDFRETVDIILKPMSGVLNGLPTYAGSALMGDGSVLMVLNIKGIL